MKMFEFRKILLKFLPKTPINNNSTLVQVMFWRRIGDKPLPEPMMTQVNDACMCHPVPKSYLPYSGLNKIANILLGTYLNTFRNCYFALNFIAACTYWHLTHRQYWFVGWPIVAYWRHMTT